RQVDDGDVGLERGAVEVGHRSRVVQHHRGVAPGDRRAGVGAAQVLDAVLADLEAGSVGLAGGQHAEHAQRQGGKSKTGSVLHAGDLRLFAQCCSWCCWWGLARLHTTPYALYPAFNRLVTLGKFAATHHFSPEAALAPHPPGNTGAHDQREQHTETEPTDVRTEERRVGKDWS